MAQIKRNKTTRTPVKAKEPLDFLFRVKTGRCPDRF